MLYGLNMDDPIPGLLRHIALFRRNVLPGSRTRLLLGADAIGWVCPAIAARLGGAGAEASAAGLVVADAGSLRAQVDGLREARLMRWRDEAFDVWSEDGRAIARIDRGALPVLGVQSRGVHLNGLVERADGLHVWVGRRRDDRPLDPGKLDHLVAGGIPAGFGPAETLSKEAREEAGIPPALIAMAAETGRIEYVIERAEGLRRDRLALYDLLLPADLVPVPQDDEVAGFELWPIAEVLRRVAETDDFKFNVNLVLIDLFLRRGVIDPTSPGGMRLRAGLDATA